MDQATFHAVAIEMRKKAADAKPMPMENEVANGVYVLDWSQPQGDYVGRVVFYRGKEFRIGEIDRDGCTAVQVGGHDKVELPVTTDDFDLAYEVRGSR